MIKTFRCADTERRPNTSRRNGRSRPILLKYSSLHSPRILAKVHCNRQFARRIVGTLIRRLLVARNTRSHVPPTSENERRLCGPGIFRVAPEMEFFNRLDPKPSSDKSESGRSTPALTGAQTAAAARLFVRPVQRVVGPAVGQRVTSQFETPRHSDCVDKSVKT
jgi:hypothetical protein